MNLRKGTELPITITLACIFLGAIVLGVFSGLVMPLRIDRLLSSGDLIEVTSPSVLESFSVTTCSIQIKSKSGTGAKLELLQSWYDLPFMVIPSTNKNLFYCVYDHDTDFQLLKIDVSSNFSRPPRNAVMSANIVNSTCEVYRVKPSETGEWTNAARIIQAMSPYQFRHQAIGGLRLGFCRIPTSQKYIVDCMFNCGNQGAGYGD